MEIGIGTMVRVTAPNSRGDTGETRVIPAVVLGVWPDGSLQLYAFHFEGSFLMRSVPMALVEVVTQPAPEAPLKFALAKE